MAAGTAVDSPLVAGSPGRAARDGSQLSLLGDSSGCGFRGADGSSTSRSSTCPSVAGGAPCAACCISAGASTRDCSSAAIADTDDGGVGNTMDVDAATLCASPHAPAGGTARSKASCSADIAAEDVDDEPVVAVVEDTTDDELAATWEADASIEPGATSASKVCPAAAAPAIFAGAAAEVSEYAAMVGSEAGTSVDGG